MKKITFLLMVTLIFSVSMAQEKNGTVYAEHEAIEKSRALWKAFVGGDVNSYRTFFADSIQMTRNGRTFKVANAEFGGNINWWKNNIKNLSVMDDKPAYPDAIEYPNGGLWVQDWLKVTGTHEGTGINIDLPIHNLYAFNQDGKVAMFIQYYDDDVFEEINNSESVRENGKVFINHPYIVTVRKLVNAYAAKDLNTVLSFYHENAIFNNTAMNWGQSINKEERRKEIESNFAGAENLKFVQKGYPDCIYYAKSNDYVVYTWWEYSFTIKETGKQVVMPLMLSHSFDKDGKIVNESAYYSTNHMD